MLSKYGPTSRHRCDELLTLHKPEASGHFVQFYENDGATIENVAYATAMTLKDGNSAVIVATEKHRLAIKAKLAKAGIDVGSALASHRLTMLDAQETLSSFLVEGWPDSGKFDETVGNVVRQALKDSGNGFVFAFGEMVALLCAAGRPDAAVHLERLWNDLGKKHRFSLYCAYPLDCFGTQPDLEIVLQICDEHGLSVPAEGPL